jgi:DDE superfamily endonuclease
LNTHTPGSFYEVPPPAKAFALAQKFDFHYTPNKGSWLNLAEIELAALATQCRDRRIPDVEALRREVLAWTDRRNRAGTTVKWRFSQTDARNKMQRHYRNIQKFN